MIATTQASSNTLQRFYRLDSSFERLEKLDRNVENLLSIFSLENFGVRTCFPATYNLWHYANLA